MTVTETATETTAATATVTPGGTATVKPGGTATKTPGGTATETTAGTPGRTSTAPTRTSTEASAEASTEASAEAANEGAGGAQGSFRAPERLAHPRPDGQDRYTISEVAALSGLSAHTLRWYERIGLMPHVDRSHTGQRRFSNRDLDWLDLVAKLRLTGMPVADMVRYAELVRAGSHTCPERHDLLVATREDVRRRIAELQGTLAVLDYKIGMYAAYRTPEND